MFTNMKGCTIYEKTVHNREPVYVRHMIENVYWEGKQAQNSGSDRTPDNEAFIAIPVSSITYVPKTDDRIIAGILDDKKPPITALTVTSVKDFHYGLLFMQHIEVKAK